ncbi:DUF4407 domain-containing protein [Flavihumibacter stibioxidans]|uniref:DUF4407 domain-containing protein n=1 Tax=Flavihumibacter stibioxidans TaxID=1834163 RepID=A0ABR7M363_9BACT|nr:DUF4407 domain-containing protein [Flavihumibacter stibioxidans]MBC6489412.1 hypothetical protein [Flavihumibacter stibioxidans]
MTQPAAGRGNDIAGYDSFSGSKGNNPFLWWCAGAHAPTLEQFPTEHPKYNTLGGVLLATFALAALSSGYAFYTIFGSLGWAAGFAVLWGLIIFNFDRFMVATIRKYGISAGRQWRMALPRIILAVMIGITIARPLELKLFEKEINLKVAENLQEKIRVYNGQQDTIHEAKVAAVLAERNLLAGRRKAMEDTLLKLQQSYVQEADGTGGSGKRGVESITLLKQGAYRQTAEQYQQNFHILDSTLGAHESFLSAATTELKKDKEDFAKAAFENVGFLERNKALHNLSEEESSVFLATFLISLLIIIIETAPVIAKLLLPVGPYDIALAKQELVPMAGIERSLIAEQEKARMSAV